MNVILVGLNGCVPVPVTKTENSCILFKVRMEVHAKKGGTVERLIKSFHPFNLLSASTFGVKRLFCMPKNPNIMNLIE